jgi:hypothetical protein
MTVRLCIRLLSAAVTPTPKICCSSLPVTWHWDSLTDRQRLFLWSSHRKYRSLHR